MRTARVYDASDVRHGRGPSISPDRPRRTPINPDRTRLSPEKALLLRVNEDEGSLTSVDRATLRSMGETPWDERPGPDGMSYAEAHGVSHDELNAPEGVTSESRILSRLRSMHDRNDNVRHLPVPMISEKQESLIERLLEQMSREVPAVFDVANDWYRDMRAAGRMSKEKATEMINRMKHHLGYEEGTWNRRVQQPAPDRVAYVPVVQAPEPIDHFDDIPDGYYALREGDHVKFFRVSTFKRALPGQDRPNRKVQSQASDTLYPMKPPAARTTLREIRDAKPYEAAMLYAREVGQCCKCGRTLTDDESRARGMGPTCYGKSGF